MVKVLCGLSDYKSFNNKALGKKFKKLDNFLDLVFI